VQRSTLLQRHQDCQGFQDTQKTNQLLLSHNRSYHVLSILKT
jgi:hypothetical protein